MLSLLQHNDFGVPLGFDGAFWQTPSSVSSSTVGTLEWLLHATASRIFINNIIITVVERFVVGIFFFVRFCRFSAKLWRLGRESQRTQNITFMTSIVNPILLHTHTHGESESFSGIYDESIYL